ncbi:MAG: cobyrinate a,c-diamide synthase [Proteobacteria bacterium]|nr:cobyrinate a,c-diamide synthase [Pseudomonadota bacterium]
MTSIPRLVIAGLGGGTGKTTLALGMAIAWRERGLDVAPFKKGPDYIDASWLEQASGGTCHHLDPFMFGQDVVYSSFIEHASSADVALIEGNRGLFDGVDISGRYSTAELAKILHSPVVLVLNCTKVTGTVAAIVYGCKHYDQELNLAGVVLNNVGTKRQERVLRQAVEEGAGVEVVGVIRRQKNMSMTERHLGLHPVQEHGAPQQMLAELGHRVSAGLNMDRLIEIAKKAPQLPPATSPLSGILGTSVGAHRAKAPRIGVLRDSSFHFYYPENLDALERHGAHLVWLDALKTNSLPPLDGLYIGGGFPETQAGSLAGNVELRAEIRQAALDGLAIYAECGGLIYLCRSLEYDNTTYPMAGVFEVDMVVQKKPAGHGYSILRALEGNPFFAAGTEIRGHTFHYSRPKKYEFPQHGFAVERGHGLDGEFAGLVCNNTVATFTHLHALATPSWAPNFVALAARRRL